MKLEGSERSYSQTMARLSGWANDPKGGKRRGWTGVAERTGLVLDCRDRGRYAEWQVSTRDGDTIGFLHEFPDHVYAFTFTGWEVRGRLRRLWHRIKGYRSESLATVTGPSPCECSLRGSRSGTPSGR